LTPADIKIGSTTSTSRASSPRCGPRSSRPRASRSIATSTSAPARSPAGARAGSDRPRPGVRRVGLGYYDKTKTTGDGQKNHDELQTIVATKGGGLTVFNISPGEDTNAFVVRGTTRRA
jgi:hypothetical protein